MYYLKNTLFLSLTKNQKASLFGYLRSFVKKHSTKSSDEILDLFIEDENYYLEVNNPHFEWIIDYFNDEKFLNELKVLVNENKKQIEIKEKQKPFIEKQKELAKQQRKKTSEIKMSKQQPTKKQLYYYDKLCKQYKIEKEDLKDKSRLDLKNIIGKILDEQQIYSKERFNNIIPE